MLPRVRFKNPLERPQLHRLCHPVPPQHLPLPALSLDDQPCTSKPRAKDDGYAWADGSRSLVWFRLAHPVAMALLSEKTHHTSPEVPPPICVSHSISRVLFLSFLRACTFSFPLV